jgi:DNA (cytosine-5)-methyltransferase 1
MDGELGQIMAKIEKESLFKFIDLFAGIGGTRFGFEQAGASCVFTSEWDKFSNQTYKENFKSGHEICGDIREVVTDKIPTHNILVAGFPCQPFSIAGVSKKNALGSPHGFKCETQGTLFFEIQRILEEKNPEAFLLENVKNLKSHDKGRTFAVIKRTLEEDLGFKIIPKIIDAKYFVPQHRERIYIVGFKKDSKVDWEKLFDWDEFKIPKNNLTLDSILHPENGKEKPEPPYTYGKNAEVAEKYTLTDHLWEYLQRYAEKHRAAGNGFGFGLVGRSDIARTLSARYYKDGSEILVMQSKGKNPRRLTPRECARLMGFPETYKIPVSDTQAYRQFGNSVVVPVIKEIAGLIIKALRRYRNLTK